MNSSLTSPAMSPVISLRPDEVRATATTRSSSEAGARPRQPTQVRTGYARRTTNEVYPDACADAASE
jgi:hypothetical protein